MAQSESAGAGKTFVSLSLHGDMETRRLLNEFPNVVTKHLRKALKPIGVDIINEAQSRLTQFQNRKWLLNDAMKSSVSVSKKTNSVVLKVGFNKNLKTERGNPGEYGWKIDHGNQQQRNTIDTGQRTVGIYKKGKRKGQFFEKKVKTVGKYREARAFIKPAIRNQIASAVPVLNAAYADAIKEIQNALNKAADNETH